MTLPRPAASLALVLALAPALAPPAAAKVRDWNQTFAVTGRPTVNVTTNDGRVRVQTGPPGAVRARVVYESRVWGATPDGDREPLVELSQSGDVVTVVAKEPSFMVVFGGIQTSLRIDVTVPVESDLEVRSGDGDVHVMQRLSGRVEVSTGDGDIRVNGARGPVRLAAGDGRVRADSLDGEVSVRSGDGPVTLSGRFDRLQVTTGDGSVRATALKGSRIGQGWRLETGDGALTVAIPRSFSADLEARTGDGVLDFRLPVRLSGELDRKQIRGRINDGGGPLVLRTRDGRLTIQVSD